MSTFAVGASLTFGSLDLTPTMEEDSVLLNIPSLLPEKLHWHEPRAGSGFKKKLAQMMGMQAKAIDPYVKEKGEGHVWGFVTHFHSIAL